MKKLFCFGSGGHARMIIETLHSLGDYEVVGLVDVNTPYHDREILGIRVLGGDDILPTLRARGVNTFIVGVGSVRDASVRMRLFELGEQSGFEAATVIHPRAIVSLSASVGTGTVVLVGAIVNGGVQIAKNVIVNTGAIIEHDCVIAAHAHIATGACLAGNVTVGEAAHVGIGATVKQGITIGTRAVVGAGAVVVANVAEGSTVVGIPARPLVHQEISL